jgi:hypothetical protein
MGYLELPWAVSSENVIVTVNMLDVVHFSDEIWFLSDGYMNSQRHRIWSNEEPYTLHEKCLQPQIIGVWCALSHRCFVPSSTRPQLTMQYKQTSHPSSFCSSKRRKSLLASPRRLHMSNLSKNNGFLEREF